jgi:VanZ family protein
MKHPFAILLTCVIALLIAYGTLKPPGVGGAPLPLTDKQIHFLAFALLTFPYGWVRPSAARWLLPLAIAYGGAIELIQPTFGRGAEWGDLLADSLGALAGVLPGLMRWRIKS